MGVVSSLMYAAASVALLALLLECCCRHRLKRLRESPQILALSVVTPGQCPLVSYPGGPRPPPAPYPVQPPAPAPPGPGLPAPAPCPPYYATPYPAAPFTQHAETPPPSYEQVMAGHCVPAPAPR